MKRRGFLGVAGLGGVAGAAAVPVGGGLSLATSPPVLMALRSDGAEVVWSVGAAALGRVEWSGPDGGSGVASADPYGMVAQGDEVLRVRIEGLRPGGAYRFRTITTGVAGGVVESPWKEFRTLDPAADRTRFVVWNDTHENDETIARLDDLSPKADFMVWNGDTCNDWHDEPKLARVLLCPAGRDFTDGRPLMPVWGNHDVRGPWAYRVPEFLASPDHRPYYAFRSGPVAAVCLHTGEDKPDDHPSFRGRVAFESLRRKQKAWLERLIEAPGFRDAPYRVVFCHIPLRWKSEASLGSADYRDGHYDHFSRASRDLWHEALVAWGAQVVISGHTHEDLVIPAQPGFPYVQITGGGPRPETATWIEGVADDASLELKVTGLDRTVRRRIRLEPLS